MSDIIQCQITGLRELETKMIALGPKLGMQAMRSALNAGAQTIKKDVQARAPFNTGKMKKNVYVTRSRSESGPTQMTYIVGIRSGKKEEIKGRDAFYWRFLEFGTKFIAARPFLRPAFESKKHEALTKFKQKLSQRLEALAR